MPQDERRKHPRIVKGFMLKYRAQGQGIEEWAGTSPIRDISLHGCLFACDQEYQPGQILELELKLPGVQECVFFLAEVKRCDATASSNIYLTAVNFQKIDEQNKAAFSKAIDFFVKKQAKK